MLECAGITWGKNSVRIPFMYHRNSIKSDFALLEFSLCLCCNSTKKYSIISICKLCQFKGDSNHETFFILG